MSFEEFQDGVYGGYLGYRNGTTFAILNRCSNASHQVFAKSHLRFGRRCRLKYFKMAAMAAVLDNRTILAILSLYNSPKPPIKFQLNRTYLFGIRCVLKNWRPSWISERNNFSNSEFLFHCDASHQVLAQSNFRFGRRCHLKNSKILDIGIEQS